MNHTEQQAADDWSVADIIILLTPHVPDEYKPQILARARKLMDFGARMAALLSLASVLSEPEMTSVCDEAFATAGQIESPWIRVRSLSEVYDVLPLTHKDRFLEVALAGSAQITNEWHKRRAMVPLARYLTEEKAERAVGIARTFTDPPTRTEVLARLANRLPEEERVEVFKQVPAIADEAARVIAMMAFVPHLPDDTKNLALTWTTELTDPSARIQALTGLSQQFPDRQADFVQEAMNIAQGMEGELDRMYALFGLVRHLSETEKAQCLEQLREMVSHIEEPSFKAGPLMSLARFAPETQKQAAWQEAFATVRQIEGQRRTVMLSVILGDLPEDARPGVLDEILLAIAK